MEHQTENMAEDDTNEIEEKLKKKVMKSVVLDSFTKLTSGADKVRINAGANLIKYLSAPENTEKESEHTYVLERLIRGIGCNSMSSKTGYYSVIVTLLTRTNTVTADLVLSVMKKQLITSGSNLKSEKADISMGQILVCGALIHSDMYTKSTDEDQKQIVELILNASKQRSYLSLAGYTFLTELLDKVNDKQFRTIWSVMKSELAKPFKEQTLDTIYFLCLARNKFPSIVKSKFLTKHLEVPDVIHEESVARLCDLLLNNLLMLQSTNHPVYQYISKEIAQTSLVPTFCAELDTQLLKVNRSKHICVTNMLTDILNNLSDHSVIPEMLTSRFLSATLTSFKTMRPKDPDTEFLDKMETFFTTLTKTLEQEEVSTKTKIAVLKKLLFYPGTFMFEKYTRLKVIQHITMNLNEDGIKKLSKLYKSVVLASKPKATGTEKTEHWINLERVYAAQMMVKLFNYPVVQTDTDWKLENLKFLLNFGLFEEPEESSVGVELASGLKDCFYRALDQKLPKLTDLRNLLSHLVHYIDETVFKSTDKKLRTPLPETGAEIWTKMMELIVNLEGKKNFKHSFAVPVFHTLVLLMGLQLFSDFELAQTSLKELHSCFDRLTLDKSPKKQKLVEGKLEENEPVWIEVVVDLFLSLLSHNSHLLRNIIGCVFPFLCSKLTMTAIRQILDVLDPKNDQNPLSKNKDSDDDEDKSDDEAQDETIEDADEEPENEEESSEESDDSGLEEEGDEENEDGHETATDKLRVALRQALHKTGYQTDDESEDIDELDEDSGKKLDAALAEAFKMVKKNNKGKKLRQTQDDKTLTHFRVRVLDLIEMYLHSEPSMLQCLEIACVILQTLEFSIRDVHQKPLEIRTRNCLKRLSGLKKFSSTEDVTEEILATMLNSFLDKGSKSAFVYQDMGDIISECCIFTIRCGQIISPATEGMTPKKKKKLQSSQIVGIFKESLETFFNKRDCLLPVVLFKSVLQISWEGNWVLVPLLVNYAFNAEIRPFRRSQALELLRIFYYNSRFRTSNLDLFKTHISPIEKELSSKTIELLQNLSSNRRECKVREKFVGLLLSLLTAVKRANASDNMDWSTIGEAVKMYRSRVSLASDAKKAYNKLCAALRIPNLVKMQQKPNGTDGESADETAEADSATQTNDEEKQTEKKKRKKAKSMKKDAHKLRKEARLLRLQASSEGLTSDTAFCAVSLSDIQLEEEHNDTSEPEHEPKRKKKKLQHNKVDEANDDEAPVVETKKSKKLKKKRAITNASDDTNEEQEQETEDAPPGKRKKPKKNK